MNHERAEPIRDVLRYVKRFTNKTIVIHIDDTIIDSPLFLSHISDISLLHEAGIHVVIVPGARQRINEILTSSNIDWELKNSLRIADASAIPLIKMAAFDTANRIMTSLAGEHKTAIIGNWVKARSKGVVDGIDYSTCGEIADIETNALKGILENQCIPIFPCIGWSAIGKPYNISSVALAGEVAIKLNAEKLFYVGYETIITNRNFIIPEDAPCDKNGTAYALTIEQSQKLITLNKNADTKTLDLLHFCSEACSNTVVRSHIVDGQIDGVILSEIFSDIGQGTMVYKSNYGGIRSMVQNDIPMVLSLMLPAIEQGFLLERTEQDLLNSYNDYIVYEMDGGIKACAALHVFNEKNEISCEIAGIVVDTNFSRIGIGPNLVSFLIEKSKLLQSSSVFILTTQTADWFESLGFIEDTIDSLPRARKELWEKKKTSKLFRLTF